MLYIILAQGFCQNSKLKLLITQFPGGFRLNSANENKPRIGIQMESS